MRHPSVHEVCVFGEPDAKWGETVTAAVVVSAPVSAGELTEFCQAHIAGFKKPRRILFVEELPKSAYGKVLRREIRAQLAAP